MWIFNIVGVLIGAWLYYWLGKQVGSYGNKLPRIHYRRASISVVLCFMAMNLILVCVFLTSGQTAFPFLSMPFMGLFCGGYIVRQGMTPTYLDQARLIIYIGEHWCTRGVNYSDGFEEFLRVQFKLDYEDAKCMQCREGDTLIHAFFAWLAKGNKHIKVCTSEELDCHLADLQRPKAMQPAPGPSSSTPSSL
jgi:hypothetical protein